jgi:hypothetical protein
MFIGIGIGENFQALGGIYVYPIGKAGFIMYDHREGAVMVIQWLANVWIKIL